LKFLAIGVQLVTRKFYNNITKTGFEFIIKRLQCELQRYTAPAAAGCKLQLSYFWYKIDTVLHNWDLDYDV